MKSNGYAFSRFTVFCFLFLILFGSQTALADDCPTPPEVVPDSENVLAPCSDCPCPVELATPGRGGETLGLIRTGVSHSGGATESAVDATLPGPAGLSWSFSRSYNTNLGNAQSTSLGRFWISGIGDSRLILQPNCVDVRWVINASSQITFIYSGGNYIAPPGYDFCLQDLGNGTFKLTNLVTGFIIYFHDPCIATVGGMPKEFTNRTWEQAGNDGYVVTLDEFGRIASITTPTLQDELISFTYASNETFRLVSVMVGPVDSEYMKVEFAYQGDCPDYSIDLGCPDDLVQVKVSNKASDGTWIVRYTQYRYNGSGQLTQVFNPDAIQAMLTSYAGVTTPEDILTKPNNYLEVNAPKLTDFATRSITYYTVNEDTCPEETLYGGVAMDETNLVKSDTTNGPCGSCGGGSSAGTVTSFIKYIKGTYWEDYDPENLVEHPTSACSINVVYSIAVVDVTTCASAPTLARREIKGFSGNGLLLRSATVETPQSTSYWCSSLVLRNDRRPLEVRSPSAHVVGGFSISQFFNPFDGDTWNEANSLSTTNGRIRVGEFSTVGWPTGTLVKKGSGGTSRYTFAVDYGDGMSEAEWEITTTYDYPTQTTTRGDGIETTRAYTYHDMGNFNRVESITTTTAAVPTAQNGPNESAVSEQYFDGTGHLIWTKDAEGYLQKRSYDAAVGGITELVIDAAEVMGSPERGDGLPTALEITTSNVYDNQGRRIEHTDASGGEHQTLYLADRTIQFPYWTGSTTLVPIEVTTFDEADNTIDSYALNPAGVTITTSMGRPTAINGEEQSDRVRWSHQEYDTRGRLVESRRYHLIPTSGSGAGLTNYYSTYFTFDPQGRPDRTIQDVSDTRRQETQTVYDFLSRTIATRVGVGVNGAGATLATVSETQYDSGGIGDSLVTWVKNYHGTAHFGETYYEATGIQYIYTFRGHVRGVVPTYYYGGAVVPVTLNDVDWMGRTTATAMLTTNPNWSTILSSDDGYAVQAATTTQSARRTLTTITFDDLGRAFRTERYRVNQSNGNLGDKLRNDTYFDQLDRAVAQVTYSQAATEIVYDGAGRQYQTRVVKSLEGGDSGGMGTFYTDGKFAYRDPQPNPYFGSASPASMSGGNDQVIEIAHQLLDEIGNTLESHSFEMNHTDTNGLSIDETGMGARDYVRRSVYSWQDGANRLVTLADYGSGDTGGGWGAWKYAAMPARPGSPPSGSDQAKLVTTTTYDAASRQATVAGKQTASKTITNKTLYDDLGRVRYSVANYVNFTWNPTTNEVSGTGGGELHDEDNVTGMEYDGLGQTTNLIALDQNADGNDDDNQVTQYVREDDFNASLTTKTIYPDSTGPTDVVEICYLLDGLVKRRTDQRGTVLDFTYNDRRQLEKQTASTLGGDTDGAIRAIKREYDSLARLLKVTSYSNTAATTAVNQNEYAFDDFGRVTTAFQEHDGVKDGSTPSVAYAYDNTDSGDLLTRAGRLLEITYPSGRVVYNYFGAEGGYGDSLSRISRLRDTDVSGAILTEYCYNGTGRLVETRYKSDSVDPEVFLARFDSGTPTDYQYLDRFGRVKTQLWKSSGGTLDQFNYDHDLEGNRISRDIPGTLVATQDQVYSYDGLNRLRDYEEGTIDGGVIPSPAKEAAYTLDGTGNWKEYLEKISGETTFNQFREHNSVNEVTELLVKTGCAWTTPQYDAAGNMTLSPSPLDPTDSSQDHTYIWDSWNRLVEVEKDAVTVIALSYDGLGRRIVKSSSGTNHHYYVSEDNQNLEERTQTGMGGPTVRNEFVWHPHYVDSLAMRYDNTGMSGVNYFSLHDANYNVTAMIDDSADVQERYHYNPYGDVTFLDGSFANPSATSSINQENLFTGRQRDPETGLYYFRTRIFDPWFGFISRDFSGYVDGPNLYRAYFVLGGVDPFGTSTVVGKAGEMTIDSKETYSWQDERYKDEQNRLFLGAPWNMVVVLQTTDFLIQGAMIRESSLGVSGGSDVGTLFTRIKEIRWWDRPRIDLIGGALKSKQSMNDIICRKTVYVRQSCWCETRPGFLTPEDRYIKVYMHGGTIRTFGLPVILQCDVSRAETRLEEIIKTLNSQHHSMCIDGLDLKNVPRLDSENSLLESLPASAVKYKKGTHDPYEFYLPYEYPRMWH